MCLFKHDWIINDTQRTFREFIMEGKIAATLILYKCKKCGKFKTKYIKGFWSYQELIKH